MGNASRERWTRFLVSDMEEWKDSAPDEEDIVSVPVAEAEEDLISDELETEEVLHTDADLADEAADDEEEADDIDAEEDEIDEATRKAEARRAAWKEFKSNLLFFGISFIAIYLLFYIFPPYLVSGTSMNKTLTDKAFGFGIRYCNLEKGDIVVFSNSKTNGSDYIKRVIACPGDTLEIINHDVYVNGKLIKEDYAYYDQGILGSEYIITPDGTQTPKYHLEKMTLGDDEYFVMGDNRNHSLDSRRIGVIHKGDVKCKMLFFLWGKH